MALTSFWWEYGPDGVTFPFLSPIATANDGNFAHNDFSLSGLDPGTIVYARVGAENAAGRVYTQALKLIADISGGAPIIGQRPIIENVTATPFGGNGYAFAADITCVPGASWYATVTETTPDFPAYSFGAAYNFFLANAGGQNGDRWWYYAQLPLGVYDGSFSEWISGVTPGRKLRCLVCAEGDAQGLPGHTFTVRDFVITPNNQIAMRLNNLNGSLARLTNKGGYSFSYAAITAGDKVIPIPIALPGHGGPAGFGIGSPGRLRWSNDQALPTYLQGEKWIVDLYKPETGVAQGVVLSDTPGGPPIVPTDDIYSDQSSGSLPLLILEHTPDVGLQTLPGGNLPQKITSQHVHVDAGGLTPGRGYKVVFTALNIFGLTTAEHTFTT